MTFSPRLLHLLLWTLGIAVLPIVLGRSFWPWLAGVWVLLVSAALWDLLYLYRLQPVISIEVPGFMGVGQTVDLHVQIGRRGKFALLTACRAEVGYPLVNSKETQFLVPSGQKRHALALSATHRGEGTLSAIWLKFYGPLGLLQRIVHKPVDKRIKVVPNVALVRKLALQYFANLRSVGGIRIKRLEFGDGEFDYLDKYLPGMDLRTVDWKSSARHQALRVRRFRTERNQHLVISLDCGRIMAEPIGGLQRLDHAIHSGLLTAYAALRSGDRVGLHGYGGRPRAWLPPTAGTTHLQRIIHASSQLHTEDHETNHVLGLHNLLSNLQRRSLVLVFSDFVDTTTAELMTEYLGQIAKKHLVVFVALEDPSLRILHRPKPQDVEEVARSIVASKLAQARTQVLLKLRRLGVEVVSVSPDQAVHAVLGKYIAIKRQGRIG